MEFIEGLVAECKNDELLISKVHVFMKAWMKQFDIRVALYKAVKEAREYEKVSVLLKRSAIFTLDECYKNILVWQINMEMLHREITGNKIAPKLYEPLWAYFKKAYDAIVSNFPTEVLSEETLKTLSDMKTHFEIPPLEF